MGFVLDIQKFIERTTGRADRIQRRTVLEIADRVIKRSPVGDPSRWKNPKSAPPGYHGGHFRANWQLGVGRVPTGTVDAIDNGGDRTLATIAGGLPGRVGDQALFIGNNLPYAEALEDGHSGQAPNGMVGLTAAEFGGILEDIASQEGLK